MKDILEEIIACKRQEVAALKETITAQELLSRCNLDAPNISMKASLAASSTGIIAEFKRRSPSKGWIKEDGDASLVPSSYEQSGASALSILTDSPFFGGSTADILTARPMVSLPILRKDFIIDEYQLFGAKAIGANAVLLIAACLSTEEANTLAAKAHELKLEVLLEIHQEDGCGAIVPTGRTASQRNRKGIRERHLPPGDHTGPAASRVQRIPYR